MDVSWQASENDIGLTSREAVQIGAGLELVCKVIFHPPKIVLCGAVRECPLLEMLF